MAAENVLLERRREAASTRRATQGPLFTWRFPSAHRTWLPALPIRTTASAGTPGESLYAPTELILVVEDDLSILTAVSEILELEGYRVERAANGAQGLAALDRERPALILLDMRMPVLNGWEFARALDQRGIKIPTLVMTAARDARRWAQEIGAEGFVSKPFHIVDLIIAVEALIGRARGSTS